MSISYNESKGLFRLNTKGSSYQMQVDDYGFLRHLYYGKKIEHADMRYMHIDYDRSFSCNPNCAGTNRAVSLDVIPQEYTSCGLGDFRISSIGMIHADDSFAAEFHYVSYEIRRG